MKGYKTIVALCFMLLCWTFLLTYIATIYNERFGLWYFAAGSILLVIGSNGILNLLKK
ncbi:hypothetical protein [Halalkalibacterium ligniniphilum]|uniref:hypothetical protein n=1 Tax=Halalkalibacterium ligniniphilum TaxID=1134413 RepID=UPI00034A253B|nr:hypothetical protein [Halalkalibacterium ligniniphilum]